MALTDLALRKARPGPKPYKIGDSQGLFLLVQPSGGKLWRLKFRVDGLEKKLAIGTYPEIGLGEARRRRDEAREAVAAGKDPAREMIKLTTWLGHANPDHTFWYIEAVPELLELAMARATRLSGEAEQ